MAPTTLARMRFPFPDQSFDAILLCEVLEHLTYSPLPMFREIKRVLRPDGHLDEYP